MPGFRHRAVGFHAADALASFLDRDVADGAVEEKIEERFVADQGFEFQVPAFRAPGGIAAEVVEKKFLDQPGFARVGEVALGGANRRHPDFGAGIAAEDRTVLNERRARPLPRGGDGRANAGQPAANDDEIMMVWDRFHR